MGYTAAGGPPGPGPVATPEGLTMRMFSRNGMRGLASVALAVAAGCDGGGRPSVSSSRTKAVVSGMVTVKGKPAAGRKVMFSAANVARKDVLPVETEIGKDGRYRVETLTGGNAVSVVGVKHKRQETGYGSQAFDVRDGENVLDIALPRPSP